jgi:ABC-type multidrug transport system fused ATPase/permease subunit
MTASPHRPSTLTLFDPRSPSFRKRFVVVNFPSAILAYVFAQPELLAGTLRKNLDMFGKHDDAELHDALRSAGLFTLHAEGNESRLTLDSQIAVGGGNLSVGQRQIIALARAMVRQSKLLILDEATSAVDYETDAVIQASLRTQLKSDVTVICVAHRLQSVMDSDKIVSRSFWPSAVPFN